MTGTAPKSVRRSAIWLTYAKYHAQGLEIVALDFEEPEQQNTLKRVNAFIKQIRCLHVSNSPALPPICGTNPPQAVNLNTWPATLFIGRDGKVKATHAGFAGPGSGIYPRATRDEFTSNIERLLREQSTVTLRLPSQQLSAEVFRVWHATCDPFCGSLCCGRSDTDCPRPDCIFASRSDLECRLTVDGKPGGVLKAGNEIRVAVTPGEHRVEACPLGGGARWETALTVKAADEAVLAIPLRAAVERAAVKEERGSWVDRSTN